MSADFQLKLKGFYDKILCIFIHFPIFRGLKVIEQLTEVASSEALGHKIQFIKQYLCIIGVLQIPDMH